MYFFFDTLQFKTCKAPLSVAKEIYLLDFDYPGGTWVKGTTTIAKNNKIGHLLVILLEMGNFSFSYTLLLTFSIAFK